VNLAPDQALHPFILHLYVLMLKFSNFLTAIALLSLSACTIEQTTTPPPKPAPVASAVPKASTKPAPVAKDENYQLALDSAASAKSISQSAQSPDDWQLVVSRWKQAIAHLKKVPKTDKNHKAANQKLASFAEQRSKAQAKADGIGKEKISTLDAGLTVDRRLSEAELAANYENTKRVYQIPIKYRKSRIPVIDVTFNGGQTYEMMVDTGASGTLITAEMAENLGGEVLGTARVGTASGVAQMQVMKIGSISVAGRAIRDVPVTVGPLDVGLLGHDFFGECNITIKQDTIEFGQCGAL
jgi:predicted aspartyl protease